MVVKFSTRTQSVLETHKRTLTNKARVCVCVCKEDLLVSVLVCRQTIRIMVESRGKRCCVLYLYPVLFF